MLFNAYKSCLNFHLDCNEFNNVIFFYFRFFLAVLFIICIIFISLPFLENNQTVILYETSFYNVSVEGDINSRDVTRSPQLVQANTKANIFTNDIDVSKPSKCTVPKTNVAFLKVHKAGSTTVMNIFLRFGDSHSLNIVLPKTTKQHAFNYLGYGKSIQKERINRIPGNETYSILCNHVVYNKTVFQEVLGPNVINIAIIREPFTHFPSAASYYGLINKMRKRLGIKIDDQRLLSAYLMSPSIFGHHHRTHNGMFADFGLASNQYYNETAINKYLLDLEKDFALVMLIEYFEESLVLMKRILCWDLKDILFVPLNINKKKQKHPINLSEQDKRNLFKYNYADFKLYFFFREKLFKQIKNAGDDFQPEVKHFKNIHLSVKKYCYQNQLKKFSGYVVLTMKASPWNKEFTITPGDCKFMMSAELPLLKQLMSKAEKRYNTWWENTQDNYQTSLPKRHKIA